MISGCVNDSLSVDGVEEIDLSPEKRAEAALELGRWLMNNPSQLNYVLQSVMPIVCENMECSEPCEQCGDITQTYTLCTGSTCARVDNFDLIEPHLNFLNGEFYDIEVITRGKDRPDDPTFRRRLVRQYCVKSVESYRKIESEIKTLCAVFCARAYIRLGALSGREAMLNCIKKLADNLSLTVGGETNLQKAVSSAIGKCRPSEVMWVLDFDDTDKVPEEIYEVLDQVQPKGVDKKVLEVPTPNGIHLITRPFALNEFSELTKDAQYALPTVQKQCMTVLYVPQL